MDHKQILKEEEEFHDKWAKSIKFNDLCILEAFEGPVSPEYRHAISLLGNLQNKIVLNPGCGAGEEAVYLAKKGSNVTAIDISSEMLKVARKLAVKFKISSKIKLNKMNVEVLNFSNESFDIIFGNSVLHHVDIKKSLQEFHRVLKKNGKAVFIEPLFYNPVINLYRRMAKIVRTPHEHPLKISDLKEFSKHFKKVNHYEFQMVTLLVFIFFFIFEGVHPNKDRYWKKIIREGKRYEKIFKLLYSIDKILLRYVPILRRFCWVTVIEVTK
ncbi:methyltransferase domain-containing protein [Candidatus Gottesmanbacteria bacterium]|nr:methyltransferase domain-containing protein [Candidatus Gottesmanbacteria bacterium]